MDIFFPFAGPERAFGRLRCLPAPNESGDARLALYIGPSNTNERTQEANRVLPRARHDLAETRPDLYGRRVRIRVEIEGDATAGDIQSFDGGSWHLALAIADRLLLEGATPRRRIFATGVIVAEKGGQIGPVSGMDVKAQHVATSVDRGIDDRDVFLFPAANLRDLSSDTAAIIELLRRDGVIVHAATNMAELAFMWRSGCS